MLTAAKRSMPSILAISFVPWTATPPLLWSTKSAPPRSVTRSCYLSKNSCPSTHKWKRKRNKAATRISLSAWSCTIRMKMAPCCWLNFNTLSSLWVCSNWINVLLILAILRLYRTVVSSLARTIAYDLVLKRYILWIIGENLTNEQVDEVFKDCMGEEDDDGNIKYARKYFCEGE